MNWKRRFQQIILERGKSYYKYGHVQDLSYEEDVYTARVVGDASYRVEIKIRDDELVYAKCSCPYAASGKYCKHMAAVMYAIDDKGDELKQMSLEWKENKVQPFEISEDIYQYFDLGRMMKGIEFSEKKYEEAKSLVAKQVVVLQKVETGYHHFMKGVVLCGIVRGTIRDGKYQKPISILFDREGIIQASCNASGCGARYENMYYYSSKVICKHMLALLILLEKYLKKYNPGDATDSAGAAFLRKFRIQHVKEVIEKNTEQVQDLTLEPVLEKGREDLYITFKIGTGKLYVIKNLTDFVNTYENQSTLVLGTKTEIDTAKHRITDESRELYAYVRNIVKEELNRAEHARTSMHSYYVPVEIKNRIELYGERLDAFYDLYEGKHVACNDKSDGKTKKTTVELKEGKPNICLKVEKDMDAEQVFHGIQVTGKIPDYIRGNRYQYYFKKDAFCRINREVAEEIQPLMEAGEYGQISFSVGRKHLAEFYHQVLPMLKQNVQVEEVEPEVVKEYIPPEPVFAFYLDAENGVVSCRPKAQYGENTVSLMECYSNESIFEAFRNRNQEEEILYHLEKLFPVIDMENDEMQCEESEDALMSFLDSGMEKLMALGEVHTTDRFRNMNMRKAPKLKVGVSIASDIMNLSVSSDELEQEELLELLQSYRRRKKYYRLKNGDFIAVNDADMDMLVQMMESLQISPKEFVKGNMKLPVYRALYLNKMLEQGENIYLNRDRHFKNLIKEFKTVEDSDFEVPGSLSDVMRKYQVQGFKWMKTLERYGFGGILADDMGLGKTLQMISVLLSAKENGKSGTALIVSPASLVYNWGEECKKFAPELKVTLVVGSQQERVKLIENYQDSDVLVTSYDLLKRDIAEYEGSEFSYQILDEAQYIKNHSTAAAKSVKIIKSKYRYALTGTPIENRLSELWSIFDYLMPGFLYSYERFRKELETPIVKHKDENASLRLKKMVSPFILRRLKMDVLKDLPDKMEEIRYAKLEAEQQKLYDGQVIHMKNLIASQDAEDFQKNKLQILAELTKIRQICCDPELLFEKYHGESAKRMACMELIESAIEGEHKILVFSQFTSMLGLLERDLKKNGILYYKIIGATPKEKRVEMVNAFNKDNTPVFLISLKAGGTGLNLTGADVVIHYDPWWNQAVQNQATDRAHRIGQSKVVSVYKLIAKGTIEEKIVKMQENKKDLADTILSGENGNITQMSKEELMELLAE